MQFELEGVTFNVVFHQDNNREYTMLASTDTPFCHDITYSTALCCEKEVDELTNELLAKNVTASYDESRYNLTLCYGDKKYKLHFDDDPDVYTVADFVAKLKNYHELKTQMIALRKEVEGTQNMLSSLLTLFSAQ